MVERAAGDGYRLGPELVALGGRARGAADLRAAARPELLALARTRGRPRRWRSWWGGTRDPGRGDRRPHGRVAASLGTRWPAHATSTGKVLLAYSREGGRPPRWRGAWPALTPRTVTDPAALRPRAERVREQGFAIGSRGAGARVRGGGGAGARRAGDVVAALSVGGPRGAPTADALRARERRVTAAARGSGRLG